MEYPAKIEKNSKGGYTVTFRDLPEAVTDGNTYRSALLMAEESLKKALNRCFRVKVPMPKPSAPNEDEVIIYLPASIVVKALLMDTLVKEGITQAQLAKKMGIPSQHITRLTRLNSMTKLDTMEKAFRAIGKELIITAKQEKY